MNVNAVLAQRFTVVRHIKHHRIHAGLRRFAKHIHETRKDVIGVKDGVVVAVDYFLIHTMTFCTGSVFSSTVSFAPQLKAPGRTVSSAANGCGEP